MKKLIIITIIAVAGLLHCNAQTKITDKIPAMFTGNFTDDYGIKYAITDTLWLQQPRTRFHIIRWNVAQKYLIARNDAKNPGDGNLYTRIDFMRFNDMEPWRWGYCLSAYSAKSDNEAEAVAIADRAHPKTGCNGYPFSRMKVMEK